MVAGEAGKGKRAFFAFVVPNLFRDNGRQWRVLLKQVQHDEIGFL